MKAPEVGTYVTCIQWGKGIRYLYGESQSTFQSAYDWATHELARLMAGRKGKPGARPTIIVFRVEEVLQGATK